MLKLHHYIRLAARCVGIAVVACLLQLQVVAAESAAFAQSFETDDELTFGALVSLKSNSPNKVEYASQDRVGQIVGIIGQNPLIELSDTQRSVQVVTGGVTTALVSNINGEVKTGDKVTASPIAGVGMKVTEATLIVGTAQADLSSVEVKERTITDRDGKQITVQVGQIPVQVHVTFFAATATQADFVPAFLQNVANAVAGKAVSPVRVIAGFLVLLLALISVTVLLYTSVRSSIISIGRNPLSENAVHKSLIEVGITIFSILLLTFITIYLILIT